MDKLLFVLAAVFVVVGAVMWGFISSPAVPEPQLTCLFPVQFTTQMIIYGNRVCSSGMAELHNFSIGDEIPPPENNDTLVSESTTEIKYLIDYKYTADICRYSNGVWSISLLLELLTQILIMQ